MKHGKMVQNIKVIILKNNLLARVVDYSIEKGYNIYSTERTEDVKWYCNSY